MKKSLIAVASESCRRFLYQPKAHVFRLQLVFLSLERERLYRCDLLKCILRSDCSSFRFYQNNCRSILWNAHIESEWERCSHSNTEQLWWFPFHQWIVKNVLCNCRGFRIRNNLSEFLLRFLVSKRCARTDKYSMLCRNRSINLRPDNLHESCDTDP